MDWLRDGERVARLRCELESWVESSAGALERLLQGYGLRVDARRLLWRALREYFYFNLPLDFLGWCSERVVEEVGDLVDAPREVVDVLLRSPYDSVVVLRGDRAWVKRRKEDSSHPLVFHVSYRTVRFREPLDPLGAALALRARYSVGSEVRVVTEDGKEHSFNVDNVSKELVERAKKILLEAPRSGAAPLSSP